MTGRDNLPAGTGGTPGTVQDLPQVHGQAGAGVCASVPCVPPVPPSISSKTIKKIDRNALRNAPERLSWFVAETAVKAEPRIITKLQELRIEAYQPVETHIRRLGRRRIKVETPLLPRYLFVRLPVLWDKAIGKMHLLRDVHGLIGLVAVAGSPRPIADRWIEALRQAEEAGAFDYRPRGRPNYEAGKKVRVLTGSMADRIAEIVCATKGGRLKILLEPLDARGAPIDNAHPLRVKIAPSDVELLEPEAAAPAHWPPPPDITP